jgi:hypothetical protein
MADKYYDTEKMADIISVLIDMCFEIQGRENIKNILEEKK